jgi:acyl transferase domain-containing protein
MLSVGLLEDHVNGLLPNINKSEVAYGVPLACVNSPSNVTLSGEDSLVSQLKAKLDEKDAFSCKLRVTVAYHSPQMETVSTKYMPLISSLKAPADVVNSPKIPMISSVTGEQIDTSRLLDPGYWARNITSPVRFSQALLAMCAKDHTSLAKKIDRSHLSASVVDHRVEIGPHARLQGPIGETLSLSPRKTATGYTSS